MIAPMPRDVSWTGPSVRFRRLAPCSDSATSWSRGLTRKRDIRRESLSEKRPQAVLEAIHGIVRREHDAADRIERKPDKRAAFDQLFRPAPLAVQAIEGAVAGDGIDDVERAGRVERQPLPASKAFGEFVNRTVGRDAIDDIARRERRRRHIERAVRPEREVERRDAWRERRELHRTAIADGEHGPRAIAYIQPAVRPERDPARDTKVRGMCRYRSVAIDAIDAAVETARDVQVTVRPKRHGRGIRKVGDEGLPGAVPANNVD